MSSYWVNFATSGDPNGKQLPQWPAFTDTNGAVLHLGDPITVGGVVNASGLGAFDSVYTTLRARPL